MDDWVVHREGKEEPWAAEIWMDDDRRDAEMDEYERG